MVSQQVPEMFFSLLKSLPLAGSSPRAFLSLSLFYADAYLEYTSSTELLILDVHMNVFKLFALFIYLLFLLVLPELLSVSAHGNLLF